MSTDQDDPEYDDNDNIDEVNLPEPARKRLRQLTKENKRIAELEAQNARYQQRESIRSAGLDLNDDQVTALIATHKGESTPEALRETAERLKFVQSTPEVDPELEQAHERLANARTGGERVVDTSYEDELKAARTPQQVEEVARKHNRAWAG
jgi:uncharacterized protein YceH (UPF0502 family)